MSRASLSLRSLLLSTLLLHMASGHAGAQADPASEDPVTNASVASDVPELAAATGAGSDPDEATEVVHEPHRHAIFLYPYSLMRRGFVAGYEYAVPQTRLGLIVEYSFERRARGDFRSTASGFGLGWRFYFMGRSRFGNFDGRACVGPFIGGMGSLRIVGVRDANGRDVVGRATRGTAEAQLGVRFPIRAKAELSTLFTAGLNTDFVGGLALQLRPTVGFAFTLGVLL